MAKGNIGARVGEERVKAIQKLVDDGVYATITDFINDAIDEKLDPEGYREAKLKRIVEDLKSPEIREELKRIIKDL
jgi:Arc/MetJ-type ribon-helix-helix transcriptional regulator